MKLGNADSASEVVSVPNADVYNNSQGDLDVYTPTGQLVYQEVLPEECQSIAVLPPADASGVQELLVGGEHTVWRYRLN